MTTKSPAISADNDGHFRKPEDEFSTDPYILISQARSVEVLRVNQPDYQLPRYYLVFSRHVRVQAPEGYRCDVNEMTWGVQIVAYPCLESGLVSVWDERYEWDDFDYPTAVNKLRYGVVNDLIFPSKCESAL